MRNTIALIIMAYSVSGCAHVFYKEGATQQDFAQDKYACMRDVRATNFDEGWGNRRFYNECMNAKGWYEVAPVAPPKPEQTAESIKSRCDAVHWLCTDGSPHCDENRKQLDADGISCPGVNRPPFLTAK